MSAAVKHQRVVSLGCRLNISEGAQIAHALAESGRDDVLVVNSCAVTREAARKSLQTARRLKRQNPGKKIIFTGCAAQIDPDAYRDIPEITQIIGNHEKMTLPTHLDAKDDSPTVGDIFTLTETALHLVESMSASHSRGFLQIQNGCDHRCSFCIIPYGRGNSRSVAPKSVIAQIRHWVETHGMAEVVLTGVDLTSYHCQDDTGDIWRLGRLVKEILSRVPELPRLRLSSLDCIEIDEELRECFAEPRLMPHLHLSLQSGSNLILKRMKRRHAREDAIKLCEDLRRIRPDLVLGADLIAGFPTETQAHFAQTCALIEECGLTWLHVFAFSPRENTPATRMPQLPKHIIHQRAKILRTIGKQRAEACRRSLIGQTLPIVLERNLTGHSPQFAAVKLDAGEASQAQSRIGEIVDIRITHCDDSHLIGRPA